MTLDEMRAHIDRLITKLRVTRFHFADDLDVHWIDDREEAMVITDADPVQIHLPSYLTNELLCMAGNPTKLSGPLYTRFGIVPRASEL
jgi:hypothetical protein